MKIGKIPETILNRSVLNQIKYNKNENGTGAGVGADCAFLTCGGLKPAAFSIEPFCMDCKDQAAYAIISAMNNVAAGGAVPEGILLSILLPPNSEETDLKKIMKLAEETCSKYAVRIMGGHTEITDGVTRPIITAVGIGIGQEKNLRPETVKPGQDIVVSKWIGLEGTSLIAQAYKEKLLDRYPQRLIDEAIAYDKYLSVLPEAATAVKSGVCAMHDARSGGIFGALWELAESAEVGLKVDIKKIPVKQETIEVCEFIDVNPYELLSGGMLLMVTENGLDLVAALSKEGISSAVIGKTTSDNDRIVINGEETRFLERPKGDEIYRIIK